jgi:hypothetical protein
VYHDGSYTTVHVPGEYALAYGINNLGQIVGLDAQGGFLATPAPVPEPSTLLLLGLGTLSLLRWAWWRR